MRLDLFTENDIDFVEKGNHYLTELVTVKEEKDKKGWTRLIFLWKVVSGVETGKYIIYENLIRRSYVDKEIIVLHNAQKFKDFLARFDISNLNFVKILNKHMILYVDSFLDYGGLTTSVNYPDEDCIIKIPDEIYNGIKILRKPIPVATMKNVKFVEKSGFYLSKIVDVDIKKTIVDERDKESLEVTFEIIDTSNQRGRIIQQSFIYKGGYTEIDEKQFRAELRKFFLMFDIPDYDLDKLLYKIAIIEVGDDSPSIYYYYPLTSKVIDDMLNYCTL